MEEVVKIYVDRAEAQATFGVNSDTIRVYVKNAEAIARATDKIIYISDEKHLVPNNSCYSLRDIVEEYIHEKAKEAVKSGQMRDGIAVVTLDENELRAYIENEDKKAKQIQKQKDAVAQLRNELGLNTSAERFLSDEEKQKLDELLEKKVEIERALETKVFSDEEFHVEIEKLRNIRLYALRFVHICEERKLMKEINELKEKIKKLEDIIQTTKEKLARDEIRELKIFLDILEDDEDDEEEDE